MKPIFLVGIVVTILGLASLLVEIPSRERHGIEAGGVSIGVETQTDEKVSPILSAVMILAGVGLMVAGKGNR